MNIDFQMDGQSPNRNNLGSLHIKLMAGAFNRLLWMEPGGNFKTYDKRHLFRMANEHKTFSAGESLLISSWKGWRICPLVCYDLRFPCGRDFLMGCDSQKTFLRCGSLCSQLAYCTHRCLEYFVESQSHRKSELHHRC